MDVIEMEALTPKANGPGSRKAEFRRAPLKAYVIRIVRQRVDIFRDRDLDHLLDRRNLRKIPIEQIAHRLRAAAKRLLKRLLVPHMERRQHLLQAGIKLLDHAPPFPRWQDSGIGQEAGRERSGTDV